MTKRRAVCAVSALIQAGAIPGDVVPRDVVPGNVVPGDVVPGNVVPRDVVPGNVVPGDVGPRGGQPVQQAVQQPATALEVHRLPIERGVQRASGEVRGPQPAIGGAGRATVEGQVEVA